MGGRFSRETDRSEESAATLKLPLLNPYTKEFEDISRENNFAEWYYNISNQTTSITYINRSDDQPNGVANIYRFGHPNYRVNADVYQKKARNPRPYHLNFQGSYNFLRYFIGYSPKDSPKYDGNTILLEISPIRYVYIDGGDIYEFTTEAEIIDYVSIMGNNSVPYPYALDRNGNYYLISEKVVLRSLDMSLLDHSDPYYYYYFPSKTNQKFTVSLMNVIRT